MKFSRRGAKDNRKRLVWSKYFKYILEGKGYYIKQKAYATYCDGWIDTEMITKETYEKAVKRGNECKEIIVEKDILGVSEWCLAMIFSERYSMNEGDIRKLVYRSKEDIKKIKKHSTTSADTEYRMFKRVLERHISLVEEDIAI